MSAVPSGVQPITYWTWDEKYRFRLPDGNSNEETFDDTHRRVVQGVYANDSNLTEVHAEKALRAMQQWAWCPAGRIHAGAGTGKRVTLINCFVSPDIEDSMRTERDINSKGIMDALNVAAYTQQMGGGIGMCFSTLRPRHALVKRTGSVSSGPLVFMDMWHAMCSTVMSSGSRRGAMMATMHCWHPDIVEFVTAKRAQGRLTNFNMSVLVTAAFMEAVREDKMWDLGFHVPRGDGQHVAIYNRETSEAWYVYERLPARKLWDIITEGTYEYAEPGVIFIDRINEMNNLGYCENIVATNPCGEQPLPANGDCNLGAVNLAQLVRSPFTSPDFNFTWLKELTHVGMRFLDNVLDVSLFPTEEQRLEAQAKRRTGLGITALGNCLQFMKMRYGSEDSIQLTKQIMRTIRDEAYRESIELAKERGPFPAFKRDEYLSRPFINNLPVDIQEGIYEHGIRNGVLLTIAPTGTTSLYYGNVSSGIEPSFAWYYDRKALQKDGSYITFQCEDYGYAKYKEVTGHKDGDPLPDYMVSALELPVRDHVVMQAACQQYVDASISKTINCPASMSLAEFKDVYSMAYDMGLKGCTTYRPSGVRGSVLSVKSEAPAVTTTPTRPEELEGITYKLRWPSLDHAFYVTINDEVHEDGTRTPFEIFINSKSVQHQEWITALTRTISAIFRKGGDLEFLIEELSQVHSSQGGFFVNKKYMPSLVAMIGSVIEKHFIKIGILASNEEPKMPTPEGASIQAVKGEPCPKCHAPSLFRQEGCAKCSSCGYSECSG